MSSFLNNVQSDKADGIRHIRGTAEQKANVKEAAEHVKKLPLRAAFFYFFLSGSKMPF